MRVMCINDKPLPGRIIDNNWQLKFGETYNVVAEKDIDGRHYFCLDISFPYGYLDIHFAPLSNIEESINDLKADKYLILPKHE